MSTTPDLGPRYRLLRPLGGGGQAAVWAAEDGARAGRTVALKLMTDHVVGEELELEFAYLSRLRHPGLAAAFELGTSRRGERFLVSEYVDGQPINVWWQERRLPDGLFVLAQLLAVLEFVHRRGVIHRDIKPANVLVAGEAVKLLDFGLAARVGTDAAVAGTPGYLAPELLSGGRPSPASDLYAVGALLYELLFGAPPFAGSAADRLTQQLGSDELSLPSVDVPAGLRDLAARLLAPDPAARPASAEEVLELLEELDPQSTFRAALFLVRQGLPEPILVGRDRELELARAALDRVCSGSSRTENLLIVARRGEGSTRLCDEVARLAQLRGITVQRGLRLAQGGKPFPLDPAAERAALVRRVVDTLDREGASPLLLIVDDLSTALEAQALGALQGIEKRSLILLVALSPGAMGEAELSETFSRLELRPLADVDAETLVASMLPSRWLASELPRAATRLAGGNPLVLAQLTRLVAARTVDALEKSEPRTAPPALSELVDLQSVSESLAALLRTVLEERVRSLSATERRAAALFALLEDGMDTELLELLLPEPNRAALLDALLLNGIITELQARYTISGQALGAAVLDAHSSADRRALGKLALHALCDARRRQADVVEQALVAARAGLGDEQPAPLLDGARAARAAGRLFMAVELYRAMLSLPASAERRAAVLELAALQLALGQARAAIELLRDTSVRAPVSEQPELLRALADAELRDGRTLAALETAEHASELLVGSSAEATAELLALRARILLFAGRTEEALELAEKVHAMAAPQPVAAEAQHTAGLARFYLGRSDAALAALEESRRALESVGDPLGLARVVNSLAMVHQQRSEFVSACSRYDEALALARRIGHLPFEATFLMNRGAVEQQRGRYAAAADLYEESSRVARRFGGARENAQVLHNLARLRGLLGQPDAAKTCLHRSLSLCRTLEWASLEAHNQLLEAELAIAAQEPEPARARLDAAAATFGRIGHAAGIAEVRLARARLAISRGETQEALTLALAVAEGDTSSTVKLRAHLAAGEASLVLAQSKSSQDAGAATAAVHQLRKALRLAEDTGERELLPEIHHWLARALTLSESERKQAAVHDHAAQALLQSQLEELPPALRVAFRAVPPRPAILERAGGSAGVDPKQASTSTTRQELDAELLLAILAIAKELNAEPDLQRLLERIIDHAVELAGAERGFLLMTRETKLEILVARNIDQETVRRKEFKFSRSIAEEVLSSGRPVLALDAQDDERFRDFLSVHDLRLRSVLCVPLSIHRQVRGAIYLDNRFRKEAFGSRQVELLGALAEQAAIAIGNWELAEANRRRQQDLERSRAELERLNTELERAMEQQRLQLSELDELARRQKGELEGRYRFENLVGQSAAMRELFRLMDRVKDSGVPVLLQGESGTGKELVAKALHYASTRRSGPFISVNCGAIPPSMLESELFGYERGAFTGAERRHRGLFERSDGGSLLLDEVGDMPPDLQVKLLRVLQEKRFARVGGEEEVQSDFRLLAASNKDLEELVRQGQFREDLFFRINVVGLRLPPLRERREDIPLLAEALLQRHGGQGMRLSRAALRLLIDHDWPGNVRELENEILRAVALGGATEIAPDDLSPHLQHRSQRSIPVPRGSLRAAVGELERTLAVQALRSCRGNVTEAAKQLGMTRVGLHKLMKRLGLERSNVS